MSKLKNVKVAQSKELIATLHKDAETKTKSEIAQTTATIATATTATKELKERDVKDFIVKKTRAELEKDSRVVIKEHRAYMLNDIDNDISEVYNATCYRNEKNELVLLSQKLANKFVLEFVEKLQSMTKFDAQDIMTQLKTCGGAYGDKVRNALYAISYRTTATEIEKDISAVIAIATEKQKRCIFYNVIEDSRRQKYDFIKL